MSYEGANAGIDFALRNNPAIVKAGALMIEGSLDGKYSVNPDVAPGARPATFEA